MEEQLFLFDLLYSYLERCHGTWEVLQRLRERDCYPDCYRKFVDTVSPAIHRYAILFRTLALKQLERDGRSFMIKRWATGSHPILEEFNVPVNRLKVVEIRNGVNLDLRYPLQVGLDEDMLEEILYDQSHYERPFKKVTFNAAPVEVLAELVPELP